MACRCDYENEFGDILPERTELLPGEWELEGALAAPDPDRLTRNFHLREFASRGTPIPAALRPNAERVARNLQVLRDLLGRPVHINSGYRTPAHNRAVGGVRRSQHLLARAADIHVRGMAPRDLYCTIESLVRAGRMEQGGLGLYRTFVHYDVRGTRKRWPGRGVTLPSCTTGGPTVPEPGRAGAAGAAQLRANIARIALAEWRRWDQGRRKETEPAMHPVLRDYWASGVGVRDAGDRIRRRIPWSAAFVSWVMRRAGAGAAFRYSGAHAVYILAAKANRARGAGRFRAYRAGEVAPRVGDLVCKCRAGCASNYDTIAVGMPTHCDIVVEVQPGRIVAVGGNVSDSVSTTRIPTDGRGLVHERRTFAIIRVD